MKRDDFTYTADQNPHAVRSREILKKYPEIKKYFGHYPMSAFYIVLMTGAQLSIGYYFSLKDSPWWLIFAIAYLFGAIVNHNLFVMVHESCHDAIFKSRFANRLWGVFSNIAQAAPSAMSFRNFHLLHHSYLHQYDSDADLAFHKEARLVGNSWWKKALWFLLFFVVESIRPNRLTKGNKLDPWIAFNIAFILATNLAIYWFLGGKALSYLVISTLFSVGLHPVGARWIQEHYTYREGQETYSYYGPMNKVSFYIGYHNEHHDFYRVPWVHLPKVKKIASEYYDNLYYHRSWSALIWDFIFNPSRDLYCRIVRENKNSQKELISNSPSLR